MKGLFENSHEVIGYVPQTFNKESMSLSIYDYMESRIDVEYLDYALYYQILEKLKVLGPFVYPERIVSSLSGGELLRLLFVELLKKRQYLFLMNLQTILI